VTRSGIAIDPGVRGCGVAVLEGGELIHAAYVAGTGGVPHPLLGPVKNLEDLISACAKGTEVVIELPQVYQTGRQKGRQADLIRLAVVVGGIARLCAEHKSGPLLLIEPGRWKGQVPKDIHHKRIREKLSKDELSRVDWPAASSLHHNVWDAIGLGLWRFRS